MSQPIFVHLLPSHFEPEQLRGGVAVVIDVLRASTTIATALAAGAHRVIPCASVEAARAAAAEMPRGAAVLGGERGGVRINGFRLGNSPLEYTREAVGGKSVVFTTTNGTRALARCDQADRVLVGSLIGLGAISYELARDGRPIHLVCAGTDGKISAEDVLCAGGIADQLSHGKQDESNFDDSARIARDFWRANSATPNDVLSTLRASHGGRNLIELGFDTDIERAAGVNRLAYVPEYKDGSLVLA